MLNFCLLRPWPVAVYRKHLHKLVGHSKWTVGEVSPSCGSRASRFIALNTERDPNMAAGAGAGSPCPNARSRHFHLSVCHGSTRRLRQFNVPNLKVYQIWTRKYTTRTEAQQMIKNITIFENYHQICVARGSAVGNEWPTRRNAGPWMPMKRSKRPQNWFNPRMKRKSHVRLMTLFWCTRYYMVIWLLHFFICIVTKHKQNILLFI